MPTLEQIKITLDGLQCPEHHKKAIVKLVNGEIEITQICCEVFNEVVSHKLTSLLISGDGDVNEIV